MPKIFNRAIKISGETRVINGWKFQVIEYDIEDKILRATCEGEPVDGIPYFQKSASVWDTENAIWYKNVGTTQSTEWEEVPEPEVGG